jgi:5-formyltetrahydrofolate cyclo-ligase
VPDPAAEKARLRERMRRARAAIPAAERGRLAARIESRVLTVPGLAEARTVLVFYSFGSEPETDVLVRRLHARGKRLLLPYLAEGGMEAAEVRVTDELVPSGYGPREPTRRVPVEPAEVEAVIAPGLAFDRRGCRLGYGGGHYDRFLARLGPGAVRVGVGFAAQLVDELPAEPHDERLHWIVTDAEVVEVA